MAEPISGAVFDALADPTRRRLLELLAEEGPATATALAGAFAVSRQAVVKHLGALAAAGVVSAERRGREVFYGLEPDALGQATTWLESVGRAWDRRLVALVKHLADAPPAPGDRHRPAAGGRAAGPAT